MTKKSRSALEKPGPAGFLLVDKPSGWTSHDVVDAARRWFETRRVGHLGTLDPLATGVLPLAIRAATKLAPYIADNRKSYAGSIELGVETDTLDAEGQVLRTHEGQLPAKEAIERALMGFQGEIEQVPPMYSAVKRAGVPLHKLARAGKEVERAPKLVRIDRVALVSYRAPIAEVEVDCSPGTYVRTLADDLGRQLGCGAHLRNLRHQACTKLARPDYSHADGVSFRLTLCQRFAQHTEVCSLSILCRGFDCSWQARFSTLRPPSLCR